MARGLIGGLGQGIAAGVSGYMQARDQREETDRRRSREDEVMNRQRGLWGDEDIQKDTEDTHAVSNLREFLKPGIVGHAAQAASQIRSSLAAPAAPENTPAALQSTADPAPGFIGPPAPDQTPAPASTPGGNTQTVTNIPGQGIVPQGALSQAPAVQSAQPQLAPIQDPIMADLNGKHEAMRAEAAADVDKIEAKYGNDPVVLKKRLAAYQRIIEADPKYKAIEEGIQKHVQTAYQEALSDRGKRFALGIITQNPDVMKSMGLPTEIGEDPVTGLKGVKMPDGTIFGWQALSLLGLYQSGRIDDKAFWKGLEDMAKDRVALQKAQEESKRSEYSADQRLRGAQSPRITINAGQESKADDAGKVASERYLMDHPGDDEGARKAYLDAKLGVLSPATEKNQIARDKENNLNLSRLGDRQQKEVAKSAAASKNSFGAAVINVDQAFSERNRLIAKHGQDAGLAYMAMIPKVLAAGIQTKDQKNATQPKGKPNLSTLGKNPRFPKAVWVDEDRGWYQTYADGSIKKVE
jgi:hypothetical protein